MKAFGRLVSHYSAFGKEGPLERETATSIFFNASYDLIEVAFMRLRSCS